MGSSRALAVVAMIFVACVPAPEPAAAAPSAPLAVSAVPAASAGTVAAAPSAPTTPSEVLESSRAAFDGCYAQARAKDPTLGRTKVEMTFTINADGRPQTVDLKYRNRFEDREKECMRDAALSLQFPASMQAATRARIFVWRTLIDHQQLSFDAYAKFIEDTFLSSQRLDPSTDGRSDSRPDVREAMPTAGDLRLDFDFTQTPSPPLVLKPM